MRRFLASALVSLAAALPAAAADMAEPAPVLRGALPVAEGIDFAGFYVGAFAGFNQQSFDSRNHLSAAAVGPFVNTPYGVFGDADLLTFPRRSSTQTSAFGLFVGHNWGVDGYILGLEADYTRTKLKANHRQTGIGTFVDPSPIPGFPGEAYQYTYTANIAAKAEVTDYGTIRGRIGAPMGNYMPFVTGGLAWARHSYGVDSSIVGQRRRVDPSTTPPTPLSPYAADPGAPTSSARVGDKLIFGYALGAGVEWALTSSILLRGEVMTMRFSDFAGGSNKTNAAASGTASGISSINTARVGAAVKF